VVVLVEVLMKKDTKEPANTDPAKPANVIATAKPARFKINPRNKRNGKRKSNLWNVAHYAE